VIARNDDEVAAAIVAAASVGLLAPLAETAHERRPSAHGKYVSHRLAVWCASAEDALALFARLQAVEGVITVF
jgi:putative lipoic acid-binding regulatory protein